MGTKSRAFVFAASICCMAACNGDPGKPAMVGQLFGTYDLSTFQEDSTAMPLARAVSTNFTQPGTVAVDYNQDGAAEEELSYDLNLDGAIRVNGLLVGAVSRDRRVMIGANLDAAEPRAGLTIGAAARVGGSTATSVVSGQYVSCSLGGNLATGEYWTRRAIHTADGAGSMFRAVVAQSDTAVVGTQLSYDVTSGVIQIGPYAGSVTSTGEVVMYTLLGGPEPELSVLIRRSTRNGTIMLSGRYLGFRFTREAGHTSTAQVEFTADGAGSGSMTETDSDGAGSGALFDYEVQLDGALRLGSDLLGILSADGNLLAAVDTDNSDGRISYLLAVRQA